MRKLRILDKQFLLIVVVAFTFLAFVIGVDWFTDFMSWTITAYLGMLMVTMLSVPLIYWLWNFPIKRTFKIRKGWKRSYFKPSFHLGIKEFKGSFILHKDLLKDTNRGTQKLLGFSYGLHHKDSFRIGFRIIDNNQAVIYPYYYISGKRYDDRHLAMKINLNETYYFHFRLVNGIMEIEVKNSSYAYQGALWKCGLGSVEPKIGYYLYPYYETDNEQGTLQEIRATIHSHE